MSDFFYSLTPDNILDSVEKMLGARSTGRCFALNSLENRVYEIEMEDDSKVVAKFYRPHRWSKECILEEHQFLADLGASEIPVVEPLKLKNGSTLSESSEGIFFAVFPKVRGRAPEELDDQKRIQLGRFLARLHNVGASRKALHRLSITPETYGAVSLKFLIENDWIPLELKTRYESICREIIKITTPWFQGLNTIRIHGDCHMGNLLYNNTEAFFLDFDDMLVGPAVQDIWLITGGHDEEAKRNRETLLKGYMEMREFDLQTLRLIEPLRALRFMMFSGWIAKRWKDPAFPRAFPEFNTHRYWQTEIEDLQKQLDLIQQTV